MPYLRPSPLLLLILSVLLSVLIFSCDPDEAKKKPSENNTTQDDQDDNQDQNDNNDNNDNQTNKPKPIKATKLTRAKSTLPVASLGTISSKTAANDGGTDASTKADISRTELGWVFQDKEITFSTTALDEHNNEIPAAQFVWQWRKRDKETPSSFGRTWTEITGQTTATATLTIPADERVGAYELRVSATSGKKTVNNHKETPYKFTVRKSGCPAPSTTNQPADRNALRTLVRKTPPLTDAELRAIDTSQVQSLGSLFYNQTFNKDINCWDVSNVINMTSAFLRSSMFNQDIGDWDTSKVTTMSGMFENARAFNKDISRWDTSEVTGMGNMFNGAAAFNQDLSGWDVSKIKPSYRGDFATGTPAWTKPKPSWP